MLQGQIWRFAGELLVDIPNCPVSLSDAVHGLMGQEPPAPAADVMSPVRQIHGRQAHIAQSLEAINETARMMRAQQQTEVQPQRGNAETPAPDNGASSGGQPRQQQPNVFDQMTVAMSALSNGAASQNPMQQMASTMAAAIVSPLLQAQADKRQLQEELSVMSSRLQRMESKMDSNASFYPLMSIAMARLCHQVNGLAQYLSVGCASRAAHPGQLSPTASPRPAMATPARKQLRRQENARVDTKKQIATVQQRLDEQARANLPTQPGASASSALVILTVPSHTGLRVVYPGSDGEEAWYTWKGRQALIIKHHCVDVYYALQVFNALLT